MSLNSPVLDCHFDELFKHYSLPTQYQYSPEDQALLENLKKLRQLLKRERKQVTVFGVFKSGKSTFLNALIGNQILPSRTNRATGVITRINHGAELAAELILKDGNNTQVIDWKKLNQYILLDVSQTEAKAPDNIDSVEIKLPFPLLKNNCCLIDTPGLLDNLALTERTYQEIEESDIAILILRADKLLSQSERDTIEKINTLLNGNILFVVNRLGLIEPEEQEDVLKWVKKSLQSMGNRFVGSPKVFAIDALAILNSQATEKYLEGFNNFKYSLQYLLHSPVNERVVTLSRLGILNNSLEKAGHYFQIRLEQLKQDIITRERLAQEDWQKRLDEFNKMTLMLKVKLTESKNESLKIIEQEVNNFLQEAQNILNEDDPKWPERVQEQWIFTSQKCSNLVLAKVKNALKDISLSIPPLILSEVSQITQLNLTVDNASKITQFLGGNWGLGTTRFLSQNLLGYDLKEENFKEIKTSVNRSYQELLHKADKYYSTIDENLNNYITHNQPKLEIPTQLIEARKANNTYQYLLVLVSAFQKDLTELKKQVLDWQLEFQVIWQEFSQATITLFQNQYKQNVKQFKSEADLYNLIGQVLNVQVSRWQDREEFYLVWLEGLFNYNSDLAKKFEAQLKKLQLKEFLELPATFNKLEIALFIVFILIISVVLYLGKNIGIILTVIILILSLFGLKNIRKKRIRRETQKIFEKFNQMLSNHGKKLEQVITDYICLKP